MNEPVVAPAVYRPEEEMVPPVAVHVTAGFAALVTVATNCWVPWGNKVAPVGETVMPTGGGGPAVIVMAAEALLDESCTLVAVTEKEPAVAPAVYKPLGETVPPVADQVTAVLLAPDTVAVN